MATEKQLNIIPSLVFFVIVIAVIMYMSNIEFTMQHEDVHKAIYRSHGIRSTVSVNYLDFSGVTTAGPIPVNLSDSEEAQITMEHNINEAIGYQITPIVTLLAAILGVLLCTMICLIWVLFTRKSQF